MKTRLLTLGFALLAGLSVAGAAPVNNVVIQYDHPQRFTDFRLQGRTELETTRIFSDSLGPAMSRELTRRLPGARLTLTFTDVDLAGRYEPWRGPRFYDIRFYRDETPLRLEFKYTLTDASGNVLAQGADRVYEAYYQYYREYELTEVSYNPAYYDVRAMLGWEDALTRRERTARLRPPAATPEKS